MLFGVFRLCERGDGEEKAEREGDGKDDVEERFECEADTGDPKAAGAREEDLWDKAIEEDDENNEQEGGEGDLAQAGGTGEQGIALRWA